MAVAVDRDAVRLAARLADVMNGVVVNEFCDRRGLVGCEHSGITGHDNMFGAIYAAPDGVQTGHGGGFIHAGQYPLAKRRCPPRAMPVRFIHQDER
ncbi:hypothetical protein GCM10023161_33160 [Mycobacterium paraffinicum]|uniref:Hydantoinase B/oxoprolinase domain-containing protein n=1 Tax=Mycobacterium paraffinicum TaxID=53378 RepID=A0ABP8EYX0_9MYCO